ncbi:MAG: class I SAM-dependent methyltransferase, partial [Clostridiales bacterium]|nr:class I SAM-dependent methyltransferase [Clostridiales bacterium]
EDGDITKTRDYSVYRKSFEDGALRKVNDFIDYVKPGRILDIGCATGETQQLITYQNSPSGEWVTEPVYADCK